MGQSRIRKIFLNILKYLVFFGAGLLLFLWVYRDQNPSQILNGLSQFKPGWILATFGAVVLSHLFRAIRWQMLIEPLGTKPGLLNTFLSILVMYLANYALPRLGEVSRCGILKKYERIPFSSLLGTVVVERVADVLFLSFLMIGVLAADWNMLAGFFYPERAGFERKELDIPGFAIIALLAGLAFLAVLLIWLNRNKLKEMPLFSKIWGFGAKFVDGLRSVMRLKKPWLFILLTTGIYGCYFLMTWFIVMAFEPTAGLSPMVSLAVLVMGSVGMVLPVQGGIGTYHFFALETLVMYGVSRPDGQLLTFVLYGATTLFVVVIGVIALGLLPIVNKGNTQLDPDTKPDGI
ncbi:MAG: lysylphosphatidylglycerol synthase transmembrane domain-containing protein [Bacteroidales bacterium]